MWRCNNCGYKAVKWLGKCPQCNLFNSFIKEDAENKEVQDIDADKLIIQINDEEDTEKIKEKARLITNISELDYVLGGGIYKGSVILLTGDPGVGKSTLALQIASQFNSLYIAGEESISQVRERIKRLDIKGEKLFLANTNEINQICKAVKINENKFNLIIFDSLQTITDETVEGVYGGIAQMKAIIYKIINLAKQTNIPTIVISHITKDGKIYGPKIVEHLVDVVLYLEYIDFDIRILRSLKNRYGNSFEIGLFKMTPKGLLPIPSINNYIQYVQEPSIGVVKSIIIEGTRPLLVEVQSLTNRSYYNYPIRNVNGYDLNRLNMILAVMEKYLNIKMRSYDINTNITGGLKVKDRDLDLAILVSLFSSYNNIPIEQQIAFIGEIGLNGYIYRNNYYDYKCNEARKYGMTCFESTRNIVEAINKLKNK